MLYILSVKWLSGSSQVGDHEMYQKQVQVTPFYGSAVVVEGVRNDMATIPVNVNY